MNYMKKYEEWCTNDYFDLSDRKKLREMEKDTKAIKECFSDELTFGTGGLRGIIGLGTKRLNKYTIRKTTQGLANWMKLNKKDKFAVIAYDSRNMSFEFAQEAALCLAANGICVYCFLAETPTPVLSYAVRYLHCSIGIVITASHNPAQYNGYKVYGADGAQIVSPTDRQILNSITEINNYQHIKTIGLEEARSCGLYLTVPDEVEASYLEEIKSKMIDKAHISKAKQDLKIVYTPLHGTGGRFVIPLLKSIGYKNVYVVPEQKEPNGNFPTVQVPNPEEPEAFNMALQLSKNVDADIVLATDPDADRVGLYVKEANSGDYVRFTGDMMGVLMAEYLFSKRKEKGTLSSNGAVVKTIVTTNMIDKVAKQYGLTLFEVLTGFKYIGEKIKQFESSKKYHFEFGMEESYGSLSEIYVRDKDAVTATAILCEIAAFYKSQGMTLLDYMQTLYEMYGYYKESQTSINLSEDIDLKSLVKKLYDKATSYIHNFCVTAIRDYRKGIRTEISTGKSEKLQLPPSDVLYFELENDAWCCVRPSGTEPKIKMYFGVQGKDAVDAETKLQQLKNDFVSAVKDVMI